MLSFCWCPYPNLLRLHGFGVVYKRASQFIATRKIPRREYSVSIVVCCHNERANVERCLREVNRLAPTTELLFVDDSSTGGTACGRFDAALLVNTAEYVFDSRRSHRPLRRRVAG